jgi:hypothetical protein
MRPGIIQILNGINLPLVVALVGLALVNAAMLLMAWHGLTESIPETQAAIGAVVIPILQDIEREQAKDGGKEDDSSDSTDDIPPLANPA